MDEGSGFLPNKKKEKVKMPFTPILAHRFDKNKSVIFTSKFDGVPLDKITGWTYFFECETKELAVSRAMAAIKMGGFSVDYQPTYAEATYSGIKEAFHQIDVSRFEVAGA